MKHWIGLLILGAVLALPVVAQAACVVEAATVYSAGTYLKDEKCDVNGANKVTLATQIAGEDVTNDILKVEQHFSYAGNKTADFQVKAGAGFVHNLVCSGTDATATAGSIILYDSLTEANTVIFSWAVLAIAYGTPITIPLDVVFLTGLYLGFTTTADVSCTVSYH
jgi:hypothetical protein